MKMTAVQLLEVVKRVHPDMPVDCEDYSDHSTYTLWWGTPDGTAEWTPDKPRRVAGTRRPTRGNGEPL